jgi:ATP-dependent Clp protease ATP-binding subunit ClpC
VLELSWDEARQLGHNYIGTEHLLLGLIREGEGVAARVLENLGVDLTKVRSHVIRLTWRKWRCYYWFWFWQFDFYWSL